MLIFFLFLTATARKIISHDTLLLVLQPAIRIIFMLFSSHYFLFSSFPSSMNQMDITIFLSLPHLYLVKKIHLFVYVFTCIEIFLFF